MPSSSSALKGFAWYFSRSQMAKAKENALLTAGEAFSFGTGLASQGSGKPARSAVRLAQPSVDFRRQPTRRPFAEFYRRRHPASGNLGVDGGLAEADLLLDGGQTKNGGHAAPSRVVGKVEDVFQQNDGHIGEVEVSRARQLPERERPRSILP